VLLCRQNVVDAPLVLTEIVTLKVASLPPLDLLPDQCLDAIKEQVLEEFARNHLCLCLAQGLACEHSLAEVMQGVRFDRGLISEHRRRPTVDPDFGRSWVRH